METLIPSTIIGDGGHPENRVKSYFSTKFVDTEKLSPDTSKMVKQFLAKRNGAVNAPRYISRNTSCPCGSGKRFKRCCQFK